MKRQVALRIFFKAQTKFYHTITPFMFNCHWRCALYHVVLSGLPKQLLSVYSNDTISCYYAVSWELQRLGWELHCTSLFSSSPWHIRKILRNKFWMCMMFSFEFYVKIILCLYHCMHCNKPYGFKYEFAAQIYMAPTPKTWICTAYMSWWWSTPKSCLLACHHQSFSLHCLTLP